MRCNSPYIQVVAVNFSIPEVYIWKENQYDSPGLFIYSINISKGWIFTPGKWTSIAANTSIIQGAYFFRIKTRLFRREKRAILLWEYFKARLGNPICRVYSESFPFLLFSYFFFFWNCRLICYKSDVVFKLDNRGRSICLFLDLLIIRIIKSKKNVYVTLYLTNNNALWIFLFVRGFN